MAARDQAKARAAHADVIDTVPGASLELVELDLESLASVRAAAGMILERKRVVGSASATSAPPSGSPA
ncbi:MAG TPA: hypothetical protein VK962_00185 [Actinomycetota bacterium]|nr:hypothetical protein [Actinomycetota bacterium]